MRTSLDDAIIAPAATPASHPDCRATPDVATVHHAAERGAVNLEITLAMMLSPNFSLAEAVKSETAILCGIDNTPSAGEIECLRRVAEHVLQPVRDHYGVAFAPSSWYRSVALCEEIGSKPTSQHAKGQAADFEVPGINNLALARWISKNLDFDQLILESWDAANRTARWVHCSYVGPEDNRNQALHFDGSDYLKDLPA